MAATPPAPATSRVARPARPAAEQRVLLAGGALIVLLVAAPFLLYPVFVMKLLCFALFAGAFNLLIGFAGLLSFGHAAFFGSGAYVAAHAAKVWGLEPLACVILAGLAATALGTAVGALAIRRTGIYFSMITLALSQMIYFIAVQAPFTGGEDGIQGVPRGRVLGLVDLDKPLAMYAFVAAIFLMGMFAIWRFVHSPFGQILKAIRENEVRAISLGYDVARYKLIAFAVSAGLAGVAGATKALVFQLATLTDITWQMSGEVIVITLLGGIGTMLGPLVGAVVVVSLETHLATLDVPVTMLIGAIFVACVLLFRRGIVGEIEAFLRRRS